MPHNSGRKKFGLNQGAGRATTEAYVNTPQQAGSTSNDGMARKTTTYTLGPAARTSAEHPSANFAKFLLNRSASLAAVLS